MSLSATIFWITTTTFSVVNGKNIDSTQVSYPTQYSSYSECNKSIKSKKQNYSKKKREDKNKYAYTYKTIKCEKRTIKNLSQLSLPSVSDFIKF